MNIKLIQSPTRTFTQGGTIEVDGKTVIGLSWLAKGKKDLIVYLPSNKKAVEFSTNVEFQNWLKTYLANKEIV